MEINVVRHGPVNGGAMRQRAMQFPSFKYHRDPIASGAFVEQPGVCTCCGQETQFSYAYETSPVLDQGSVLCPLCIHSGDANQKLGVNFIYPPLVSDYGHWSPVPEAVRDEVSKRTPAFFAIQQRWWTHCEDAGEYLERADGVKLLQYGEETVHRLRESEGLSREDWDDNIFQCLVGGVFHAQLFACSRCGCIGGYIDGS